MEDLLMVLVYLFVIAIIMASVLITGLVFMWLFPDIHELFPRHHHRK